MAIIPHGNNGTIVEVEANTRAVRVVRRPPNHGNLGAYSYAWISTGQAITSAQDIVSFRWTNPHAVCRVIDLCFSTVLSGAPASVNLHSWQVFFARSYTSGATGGAGITITGNNQHLRTGMGTMLMAEIRHGTITAGTRTLDTQPLWSFPSYVEPTTPIPTTILPMTRIPLACVLHQNEGIIIRSTSNALSTTWDMGGTFRWQELSAYEYGLPRK